MYQQQQQQLQSHQQHLSSSRPSLPPPEKQFLLHGGGDYSSGLILSTDAKPRLKWTPELHDRFVEAVHQLGGPEKATPKTIMRLMGIPGLTLYHLKSHLQKYRLSKNPQQAQANGVVHAKNVSGCRTATDNKQLCDQGNNGSPGSHFTLEEPQINRSSMHISEALQMQIEVQRRLHEQLEVQRHLQLRIEAQGKYLQSVLERAQEALAKQSSGVLDGADVLVGLEDAASNKTRQQKQQLLPEEELVIAKRLRRHDERHGVVGDGSADDSCLTACDAGSRFQQIRDDHREYMLLPSIGLCTPTRRGSSSSHQFGEEGSRGRASEEYSMFGLEEEPSGGGASPPPNDERCETRRSMDDDGFRGSATRLFIRTTAEHHQQLDLSINNNSGYTSTCRGRPTRDCDDDRNIDLNNDSTCWN